MHAWTKSACVGLAWSIAVISGRGRADGPAARAAQANTRIARARKLPGSPGRRAPHAGCRRRPAPAAAHAARYGVRPGDTLSGIAARFAACAAAGQALYGQPADSSALIRT